MRNFYVYRYIDKTTNKIVYIGKTGRLTVEERINQHKTDPMGLWASKNDHRIEFLELPKEEDMNYIESFLIRKHIPEYNIIFADKTKQPPFDIVIDEDLWISYDEYLENKKNYTDNMMKISQQNIASNISSVLNSNKEFEDNLKKTVLNISAIDKSFIVFLFNYQNDDKEISVHYKTLFLFYKIDENDMKQFNNITERLKNISFYGKLKGTMNRHGKSQLFSDINKIGDKLIFSFGENYQYIRDVLCSY